MNNAKFLLVVGVLLITSIIASAQLSRPNNLHAGAVYVMTNQTANAVMAFTRNPSTGTLNLVDTELTQGAGNPIPIGMDPPTDPLASQGSLIVDEDNQFVYAVNAGSNEISVLAVGKNSLSFVQKISSGGVRPISLTIYENWLYVLNEGGTPNITGFTVADDGTLTPLAGSTRPLIGGAMADPAQVGFSNDGTLLVVSEKMGNRLDTYAVGANGVAGPPNANPSSGMTPFGFAFGSGSNLFVSEAFGGMPMMSAVSSYDASETVLDVISASVPNNQTAACWVVITNSGHNIFVSNTASGTVSSYGANDAGELTLIDGDAANTGAMSAPIDMALSNNSHFLYVLENGSHVVSAWRVGKDGSLTFIGEFGMLPAGAQGIAAK
jgi:6-phosphogluconolactonase